MAVIICFTSLYPVNQYMQGEGMRVQVLKHHKKQLYTAKAASIGIFSYL
ncbi:hypothetical protein ABE288_15675 [Bacillus salipaludis]